ncbi:MAG: DUF58 domain-containing protein [Ignavibacterium sp.]|jgi:uncharacterized protein (DUF58 family)|nr:DUF58 domain-containing protein [Ignavibacterium sp.]MDX9712839.1 DUF58 domain-containing protein [Ignavibacteriaceae bacterium]MEB2353707.1 DUF58 domain-containing protein [Ignavibacteriales bacterium]
MKFLKEFYLTSRFLLLTAIIVLLFFFGYFFDPLFFVAKLLLISFITVIFVETLILFTREKNIFAERILSDRLSNGDDNEVKIILTNNYTFDINIKIIDELPFIFQIRDFEISSKVKQGNTKIFSYIIHPVKRGEYQFGYLNVFISTILNIVSRRLRFDQNKNVKVYPSYVQMRKYQIMAISDRLMEVGIKKVRKIGHSMEFEQIKDYVRGDDYRTINWKATARKRQLMVNHYIDERAQQIYSVIDMGRTMKMPFDKMSLLDYAINTSLVISNIALLKHDKAGIITFNSKVNSVLPAERNSVQMKKILDMLYKQETDFMESDYERLAGVVRTKIKQRSLLLFFTNFETANSLKRQLPYFKSLSRSHLLIVIFFFNVGLDELLYNKAKSLDEVYHKTIAEKFAYEKRVIQKELASFGIQSILTTPEKLSINTINKYLELKARAMI